MNKHLLQLRWKIRPVIATLAVRWLRSVVCGALVCAWAGTLAAQPSQSPVLAPRSAASVYESARAKQRSELAERAANRPSFVAPLVVTVASAGTAAGVLLLGALRNMGECPRSYDPAGGRYVDGCEHGIEPPLAIAAAAAAAVTLVGAVWLVDRLVARAQYNADIRRLQVELLGTRSPASSVAVSPAVGGVSLRVTF